MRGQSDRGGGIAGAGLYNHFRADARSNLFFNVWQVDATGDDERRQESGFFVTTQQRRFKQSGFTDERQKGLRLRYSAAWPKPGPTAAA